VATAPAAATTVLRACWVKSAFLGGLQGGMDFGTDRMGFFTGGWGGGGALEPQA